MRTFTSSCSSRRAPSLSTSFLHLTHGFPGRPWVPGCNTITAFPLFFMPYRIEQRCCQHSIYRANSQQSSNCSVPPRCHCRSILRNWCQEFGSMARINFAVEPEMESSLASPPNWWETRRNRWTPRSAKLHWSTSYYLLSYLLQDYRLRSCCLQAAE